jgi:hypothetical protein
MWGPEVLATFRKREKESPIYAKVRSDMPISEKDAGLYIEGLRNKAEKELNVIEKFIDIQWKRYDIYFDEHLLRGSQKENHSHEINIEYILDNLHKNKISKHWLLIII